MPVQHAHSDILSGHPKDSPSTRNNPVILQKLLAVFIHRALEPQESCTRHRIAKRLQYKQLSH
jgi:hypothetical protein